MPPHLIEALGPILGIISVGTMVLVGMKMRLTARLHESSTQNRVEKDREEVERLTDTVDALHEQVRMMRDEFTDLHERVDFAERLLSRGEISPREPAVPTPQ